MKKLFLYYRDNFFEQRVESSKIITSSKHNSDNFLKVFNSCVRQKINFQENDLAIVFYSGYTNENVKAVSNFIKTNNISKIYFFIEDVFRLKCSKTSMDLLETFSIEKYPFYTEAIELNIVKNIMRKKKVPYEVYHCEYNSSFFSQRYDINIKYFDWFSSNISRNSIDLGKINFSFNKKISCFNLRKEYHRYIISLLLKDNPDTIITCNFKISTEEFLNNQSLELDRFNIELKNKILESHSSINYSNLVWDAEKNHVESVGWIDIQPANQWNNLPLIKDSFLNLVTETRFSSPMPCFNEKTIKPILVYRPFILLAPPGTLQLLKKLGIKTFDRWWDESYDDILDHNKRLEKVYSLCLDILCT